jgi:hypothetical protein
MRLHYVHRPGDGTSGSKGNFGTCPLSDSLSSVIEAYTHCLEGHGGISCATEPSGHTPEAAQRFAPQAQRVDGVDSGRGTIGLAMIGSDHAWAASVLVHRKVEPSIHMRCRITASLRATATLARFRPRRLATSSPQRLSAEKRVTRESNTFAAS